MRATGTAEITLCMARAASTPSRSVGLVTAVGGHAARDFRQRAHGAHVGVRLERLERQRPRIVRPQDRADGIVEHLAAAVDHHDVVADLLGLRHHVRREQHRRATPMLREDQVAAEAAC